MSRQETDSASPERSSSNPSSQPGSSLELPHVEGRPSDSPQSPQGVSSSSEGYPSWLPRRPPPPAPRSTMASSMVGMYGESELAGPSNEPFMGGRKATPRSVRIVSLQGSTQDEKRSQPLREPTDQSRMFSGAAHTRVWSRATSAGMTPTLISAALSQLPRPRFRSPGLHLELLQSPSWRVRILYYLFPLFVFAHVPLQTFFDFNAVYILLLVAKFPNPVAPGVPGSGRNWALGAAAYIACWFAWIAVVFVVYELLYSFYRRWRVKRPLMLPIYLSSPAYNLVSMTSYSNFCFMSHIRLSAFSGEHGSLRDGLAETFFFWSQNLPTVALLLPRAGLSLALLLAFSSPQAGDVALADAGINSHRDGTFFRAKDGTLTSYARGVLIANAAWTAWRVLLLLVSWVGLWIFSGQGCAGLCGPRYRWEEDDVEKTVSAFNDGASDMDALPWSWKISTLLRIKDAYDFCITTKPILTKEAVKEGYREPEIPPAGLQQIFAAVGLPSGAPPARRGVLSDQLFETPVPPDDDSDPEGERAARELGFLPPAVIAKPKEKQAAGPSGPLMKLPYPFTGYGAQISSEVVPFPPSPREDEREVPIEGNVDVEGEADVGEEGGDVEDEEEEEEEDSEEPSEGRRTSGSMSSLGQPISSRYPFQYRRPTRGSVSSISQRSPPARSTPQSNNTRSTPLSGNTHSTSNSRSTQSTGNRESTDSPMSHGSSNPASPLSSSISGSVIPMPPRHPQVQRRGRAGTVPSPGSPGSPSPVTFPAGRPRARTRTGSLATEESSMVFSSVGPLTFDVDSDEEPHEHSLMEVPEPEGSVEEAEQHDSVGLLSAAPSPRTSLANLHHRGSGSHRRSNGSRSRSGPSSSRSNSRSRTNSATSRSESARSRAQSLIHSIGAASLSSIDLVRSRANSMQRLSDSPFESSASDAVLSSPENHTFGHPLREQWRAEEQQSREITDIAEIPLPASDPDSSADSTTADDLVPALHSERSTVSWGANSERPSVRSERTERMGIPITGRQPGSDSTSQPYLSTANQSFVTAPATVEGTTDSSGRTPPAWGAGLNHPLGEAIEHLPQGGSWHHP